MLYIYSFVVSVDHFPCGNESQFEKWWEDRKQNPVEVAYPIHHSIISNKNKVSQTILIFCKLKHTKSPPDCVLAEYGCSMWLLLVPEIHKKYLKQ